MVLHSAADDTSSNIDTQADTISFLISDVQQPPLTGDSLGQPEPEPGPGPGPGSSVILRTGPEELLAGESDACLDPNKDNPRGKSRVRRGSPPPDLCPSPLVPKASFTEDPKEPEIDQNAGDGGRSGSTRRVRPKKPIPERFDPLNMPKFLNGETIENPCAGLTIARNPVCDSGYFGPTTNLAACRLCTFISSNFFFGIQFIFFCFTVITISENKGLINIHDFYLRDTLSGLYFPSRKPLVLCHCKARGEFLDILSSRPRDKHTICYMF